MFNFEDVYISAGELIMTILLALAVLAVVIIIKKVIDAKNGVSHAFSTRDLTYGAVCLAFSFALSFLGFKAPQGGTVTIASIMPIMLYCYYFGFTKGSIICSAYMLLQLIQEPYIVSPWSALLDYIIPYLALSFTGLFSYSQKRYEKALLNSKNPLKVSFQAHYPILFGTVIYIIIRYASHVLSGGLLFAEYAGAQNPWIYSLGYNSFCLVDLAIALVPTIAILTSKAFNTFMTSHRYAFQKTNADAENNE